MSIKVFDTLSNKLCEFVPLVPNEVKMYVCGVTVYDECHLGHARAAICFDVIRRYFELKGYKVTMVVNFTDVDDKIINRAKLENVDALVIANRYIEKYFEAMDGLKVKRATYYPRATENIDNIIKFIEELIKLGYAYIVDNEVYFEVTKFSEYGKLSKRNLNDMLAGARIAIDTRLKNPHDFCLWKAAKEGEIYWNSPWGIGRPGWHIECSAMSSRYLGDTFDIHGGGLDLIFPHHENEIAQSEAKSGKQFVKYWLHNGLVNINSEKMSKSLGNFFTISSLLQKFSPYIIRYFILSNHYRSPINFTIEKMEEIKKPFETLIKFIIKIKNLYLNSTNYEIINKENINLKRELVKNEILKLIDEFESKFNEHMENDFNTAGAIGIIFQYIPIFSHAFNNEFENKALSARYLYITLMKYLDDLFSILDEEYLIQYENSNKEPETKLNNQLTNELIELLIKVRTMLKAEKNYKYADLIRDELKKLNIILNDTKEGTKYHFEIK